MQVNLSVQENHNALNYCSTISKDSNSKSDIMPIKQSIKEIIDDQYHFADNDGLICILKPIIDALSRLENDNSSISDVWPQFIRCYNDIKKVNVNVKFNKFKLNCLDVCKQRGKLLTDDIYIVAFFLNPKFRKVYNILSSKFNFFFFR